MTEGSENSHLVRVRAQVMCRDEASDGWNAHDGGGLATITVGKRTPAAPATSNNTANSEQEESASSTSAPPEYYIHGRRISDNMVLLECTIKRDFKYHKVMPTFHHWVTEEKRFGLTFHTAAEARAFDKGVRIAVQDILNGMDGGCSSAPHTQYNNITVPPQYDDDDQNIFECLTLPSDSVSSSENSTVTGQQPGVSQTPILAAITLPDKNLESPKNAGHSSRRPASLPDNRKEEIMGRNRCSYCYIWYHEENNHVGACDMAPDRFGSFVDSVSCVKAAQGVTYHCLTSPEGDLPAHPCQCGPPQSSCAKRWLAMIMMSVCVPCLWCYPPLHVVHVCARRCRLTGGAHSPTYSAEPPGVRPQPPTR